MPEPDAPAVLGYTSGTTGRAKGALLLQRNLLANIQAITQAWRWTADDRLLLTLPLFHAHGLMVGMHGTLLTGASVVLRRKFDASDVLSTINADPAITMFFGVPTMYGRLLAEAERLDAPPRPLRLYVSGSAPLSPQVFAEFERVFGQRILERYGMTETIMNMTNPYDGERRPGTVGAPYPGQEARVVGVADRQPLPDGEIGEIEVRGPHVFAGYWNRPDATAEAFSADGWFKTGDLGWRSADGYFTITGRARELIISGGYNIYPREVEDVLADASRSSRRSRCSVRRTPTWASRSWRSSSRKMGRPPTRTDHRLLPRTPGELQEAPPSRLRGFAPTQCAGQGAEAPVGRAHQERVRPT